MVSLFVAGEGGVHYSGKGVTKNFEEKDLYHQQTLNHTTNNVF